MTAICCVMYFLHNATLAVSQYSD